MVLRILWARFLERLKMHFADSTLVLADRDRTTRYIFSRSDYAGPEGGLYVKARAFLPNPNDGCTSMFRTEVLDENHVWTIGDAVARGSTRTLRARADVAFSVIRSQPLEVDPNNDPPGHFDVKGWPLDKEVRKHIAQEIAAEARLLLVPTA